MDEASYRMALEASNPEVRAAAFAEAFGEDPGPRLRAARVLRHLPPPPSADARARLIGALRAASPPSAARTGGLAEEAWRGLAKRLGSRSVRLEPLVDAGGPDFEPASAEEAVAVAFAGEGARIVVPAGVEVAEWIPSLAEPSRTGPFPRLVVEAGEGARVRVSHGCLASPAHPSPLLGAHVHVEAAAGARVEVAVLEHAPRTRAGASRLTARVEADAEVSWTVAALGGGASRIAPWRVGAGSGRVALAVACLARGGTVRVLGESFTRGICAEGGGIECAGGDVEVLDLDWKPSDAAAVAAFLEPVARRLPAEHAVEVARVAEFAFADRLARG